MASSNTFPSFDIRNPRDLIAYGFGAGLSDWAPGTIGTLVAIPIFVVLSFLPTMVYLLAVAAAIIAGIWAIDQIDAAKGGEDPPYIVWDEIVGFLIAMTAIPLGFMWIITGFVLFRVLDIYKPWPISIAQGRKGAFGVMLDDIVAGAMTWVVLYGMHMMVEASLRGSGHH